MKNNSPDFDVIVVGGGPAGVAAASVFVKKGLKVAMIDGANTRKIVNDHPLKDFETVRKSYPDQHKLFLGEDLSGINLNGESHASTQASGGKSYIVDEVDENLQVEVRNVEILQTLAKGGLTEIWGANCDFFDREEMDLIGLSEQQMQKYYQEIVDEIGICGNHKKYKMQPPAFVDHNARKILGNFREKSEKFKKLGLKIHLPYLALLTKNKGNRKATTYDDMEYWTEKGRSVYKARYTIEDLDKKNNFYYFKGIVISLEEDRTSVNVITNNVIYSAKYTVLAAGTLGTGRILLKSFNLYNIKFPFFTKYHVVSPCLFPANLGKRGDVKKYSFCQLIMESEKTEIGQYSYTQFYSYKSLLLYKLLNFSPFSTPESLAILSLISSALVLADTRFGTGPENGGYCFLKKNKSGKDVLNIVYKQVDKNEVFQSLPFKNVISGIKSAGLIPLKNVYMPYGSTAHYSGILSSKNGLNKSLRLDKDGKLERSDRVYVADASGWEALPAKPPTLTIMANAHRIAGNLLIKFGSS